MLELDMKQVRSFSITNKARGASHQSSLFARVTVNGKRAEISIQKLDSHLKEIGDIVALRKI